MLSWVWAESDARAPADGACPPIYEGAGVLPDERRDGPLVPDFAVGATLCSYSFDMRGSAMPLGTAEPLSGDVQALVTYLNGLLARTYGADEIPACAQMLRPAYRI